MGRGGGRGARDHEADDPEGRERAARRSRRPGRAALCQVDGRRWLTLEGTIEVADDAAEVAEALRRYEQRYRPPNPAVERVVLRVVVDRAMSSRDLA